MQKRVALLAVIVEIRTVREEMWAVAARFLISQAESQGVEGPVYIPPLGRYTDAAAESVMDEAWEKASPEQRADAATAAFVRHAENATRQTITRAVNDDYYSGRDDDDYRPAVLIGLTPAVLDDALPTGKEARAIAWARQLTGSDNCAFCVMLASRGPVYSSASAAGRIPASLKWADAKGYVNSYHDYCDCIAVPVYRNRKWEGRAEATRLYKVWQEATKGYHGNDAMNALRRHLNQMERDGQQISPDIRA